MSKYAVPKNILEVDRPKGTRINRTGDKYHVYELLYVLNEQGKTVSKSGKCIGKIQLVEDEYVFVANDYFSRNLDYNDLEYGSYCISIHFGSKILHNLREHFGDRYGIWLFVVSSLFLVNPTIPFHQLSTTYKKSYFSIAFPDIKLSPNTISKYLSNIGVMNSQRVQYMAKNICEGSGEFFTDGMLIQNSSKNNSLAVEGRADKGYDTPLINTIFIYDAQKRIPVFYKMFRGNIVDIDAIKAVITESGLTDTILIGDKGFYDEKLAQLYDDNNITYLMPLKRNSVEFHKLHNGNYDNVFRDKKTTIRYNKLALPSGRYLYIYKDEYRALLEMNEYTRKITEGNEGHDYAGLQDASLTFGVIAIVSKLDLPPKDIYYKYRSRWNIEQFHDHFKTIYKGDTSYMHSYETTQGAMLVKYITIQLFYEIYNQVRNTPDLDDKFTTFRLIDDTRDIRVTKNNGEWITNNFTKRERDIFALLGIQFNNQSKYEKQARPKGKRGRPKKEKVEDIKPKRPRGRPRKVVDNQAF